MDKIYIAAHIEDLRAYKAGKSLESLTQKSGLTQFAKLSSNENPLGPSPKAMAAAQESLKNLHLYPDPAAYQLRQTLACKLNLNADNLLFTSGVDSLLAYIMMAFSQEGDEILTSKGSFIGTYVNAKKLGRMLKTIPLKNWAYDLEGIVRAISSQTKIIYLANPNNPTGSMIDQASLDALIEQVPKHILIVLDEAYFEYACHHPHYPDGKHYINKPNIIVTRTMSKAYGLAGARVGYALAHADLIATLAKVKLPFEPSRMAQAMAKAAFEDDDFLKQTQELNKEGIDYFYTQFKRLGLNAVPDTGCNAIMLYFDNEDKAEQFNTLCFEQGLIMRPLTAFGIANGVRINTGSKEQNEFAIAVMENMISKHALK